MGEENLTKAKVILFILMSMILFAFPVSAIPNIDGNISCYDSDGTENFGVSGYAQYWWNYVGIDDERSAIKKDYCLGGIRAVDYQCGTDMKLVGGREIAGEFGGTGAFIERGFSSGNFGNNQQGGFASIPGATIDDGSNIAVFSTRVCDVGCEYGECISITPGIEIQGSFDPNNNIIHSSCRATSTHGISELTRDVKGVDEVGTLSFTASNTLYDCGPNDFCIINSIFNEANQGINLINAIPGTWTVTCTAIDGDGNNRIKTLNFNTSCGFNCPIGDTRPPIINTFTISNIANGFGFLEFESVDAPSSTLVVSGTEYMEIEIFENSNSVFGQTLECTDDMCKFYRLLQGSGTFTATITVYDNEGNSITESI